MNSAFSKSKVWEACFLATYFLVSKNWKPPKLSFWGAHSEAALNLLELNSMSADRGRWELSSRCPQSSNKLNLAQFWPNQNRQNALSLLGPTKNVENFQKKICSKNFKKTYFRVLWQFLVGTTTFYHVLTQILKINFCRFWLIFAVIYRQNLLENPKKWPWVGDQKFFKFFFDCEIWVFQVEFS